MTPLLLSTDLLKCESGSRQESEDGGSAYARRTRTAAFTFKRALRQQVCHTAFVMEMYHDSAKAGSG